MPLLAEGGSSDGTCVGMGDGASSDGGCGASKGAGLTFEGRSGAWVFEVSVAGSWEAGSWATRLRFLVGPWQAPVGSCPLSGVCVRDPWLPTKSAGSPIASERLVTGVTLLPLSQNHTFPPYRYGKSTFQNYRDGIRCAAFPILMCRSLNCPASSQRAPPLVRVSDAACCAGMAARAGTGKLPVPCFVPPRMFCVIHLASRRVPCFPSTQNVFAHTY